MLAGVGPLLGDIAGVGFDFSGDLTPIIVAFITALATMIGGGLLIVGPQRRSITQDVTDKAVRSIDAVRQALEERLTDVEGELSRARERIHELEAQLAAANELRRSEVEELSRERLDLLERVERSEERMAEMQRLLGDE